MLLFLARNCGNGVRRTATLFHGKSIIANLSKSCTSFNVLPYRSLSTDPPSKAGLQYTVKNGIAVIKMDNPNSKMNVISKELMEEMNVLMQKVQSDSTVKGAVVISAKPGCFIAGADINMLAKLKTSDEVYNLARLGHAKLDAIEQSKKPVVAAIMGPCLGGGLEVALACHYRIAVADKKTVLGLPEVQLGILPGGGGTQRLPKVVALPDALDMMLTGKNIRPEKAVKMGLIHRTVQPLGPGANTPDLNTLEYLEEVAITAAKQLASGSLSKEVVIKKSLMAKAMDFIISFDFGKDYVFKKSTEQVMKMTKGNYPAPLKIIDVIRKSLKPGVNGYDIEARAFGDLAMTKESKALFGIFFGQTECKKNNVGQPQHPVNRLAVLGAGLMGAGISQVSIEKGFSTVLKDISLKNLARGEEQIQKNLSTSVKKKKLRLAESEQIYSKLHPTTSYENFGKVDMVIEAVFEDINLKHKVIKEVEPLLPEHCVFATNTSGLPITKISEASKRPEKIIGMHYFSPVDKMPLLEIIVTAKTSKDTLASAIDVGLRQGKVIITVKDGPGFYTTRILAPIMSECFRMMLEGVTPAELDKACTKFGWPVGMATLADEVGLDVAAHISDHLGKALGVRVQGVNPQILKDLVNAGCLGRKSGKGMHLWSMSGGKSVKSENPDLSTILAPHRLTAPVPNDEERIQQRFFVRMVNEAVLCLQESILSNPVEGDIGCIFGLGFPPFYGGPFRYLDNHGAAQMVKRMEEYAKLYGAEQFTPCQLLLDHAKDASKKFHTK